MHLVLVIVGIVVMLAGAAMIGLGLPNSGGDINTQIIAGTTAFVGGLILIGLSEVVRQLRRIAESLMVRPVGRMPRDLSESAVPAMPAAPRIPFPPKTEPRHRAPMPPPEPRFDNAPSIDSGADHFDRPPAFAHSEFEPRIVPEREEMPLSPAQRHAAGHEDKDELAEGLLATAFSRLDVSLRPAPPIAEAAKPQNELFESFWPPQRAGAETEPVPAADAESAAPEQQQPEESEAPYAVSILKSGVVDGMAYTLYSDGSIEAEMPQGTMRFASITELRAYLEKSSS